MLKKVGNVTYKVELSESLSQLHPIFHVSLLKPFYQDPHDLSRNVSLRALASMSDEYDKIDEKIMTDRTVQHKNHVPSKEYLVRWCGLLKAEISWEPAKTLWQFEELIRAY